MRIASDNQERREPSEQEENIVRTAGAAALIWTFFIW
jgi:hypothetical protein